MSMVVVDPLTRIEGHLRIEAETDANNTIVDAFSSGTSFRGIEEILKGRDPREAWAFTQRFCGVCTVSNSVASVRAVEHALGKGPSGPYEIPLNAQLIRNLMMATQYVHDHVMHFYHLHALDWVNVVSATTQADPAKTAELQQCLSQWPNNTTEHFAGIQGQLQGFVQSGQLGIFANGYWNHPGYKCPAEVDLLAVAHYLESLKWQRSVARIHAIFGGKNPHPNFCVGGAPCALDLDGSTGKMAVTNANLDLIGDIIGEMRDFVDNVYLQDLKAIAVCYKDLAQQGLGEGIGNFMTFGEFPLGTDSFNTDDMWVPRGAILNYDLANPVDAVDLDLEDVTQVQEFVSNSWYNYTAGKDVGLHPYDGETTPAYTGPTPPYTSLEPQFGPYSWVKSPRWKGHPMEVGPLARLLMLYAKPQAPGHEATKELVDQTLAELKLPLSALFSTVGRMAARALEAKLIADAMKGWYDDLRHNINVVGDLSTHNAAMWNPQTWPTTTEGVGFQEAPRGGLAHWIKISNQKIDNYQAIIPTTWNGGPKDNFGQLGPYEAALVGQTLHDPEQPLEILRTIHSFDPCLACAVHVVDPDGQPLVEVKVR